MNPALIQLIVTLAPYGVQVVLALIGLLQTLLDKGHEPSGLTAVTQYIIDGINEAHPDWAPEQRTQYAKDAIAVWANRHPPVPA